MVGSGEFLNAAEAARRLGVSAKALRLYERRGLVSPLRTGAGWRAYGPEQMARAGEVAAMRALGLGLAQIEALLGLPPEALAAALASHQSALDARLRELGLATERVRGVRADLAAGRPLAASAFVALVQETAPDAGQSLSFALPWPWGGEAFSIGALRPLSYIVGPLGSGKTRFAQQIAAHLPDTDFVGVERLGDDGAAAFERLDGDPALRARVAAFLQRLEADGADRSREIAGLVALASVLEAPAPRNLVVDMPEHGLGETVQRNLVRELRRRAAAEPDRAVFLLTRSNAILDLAEVGPHEAVFLCPANHAPPTAITPHPGGAGYEAVATCLASPQVRARTEGMVVVSGR